VPELIFFSRLVDATKIFSCYKLFKNTEIGPQEILDYFIPTSSRLSIRPLGNVDYIKDDMHALRFLFSRAKQLLSSICGEESRSDLLKLE
jgi:hypothetical protein